LALWNMPKPQKRQREEEVDAASDPSEGASSAEDEAAVARYPTVTRRSTHKKKKVLVLCSRGVTSSYIELMEDLLKLMPHAHKDPKFDKREPLASLVEIAELSACAACLYFEARKMKDLYMWLGAVRTAGPCAKFLVQQVRPMRDIRLTGNCLMGTRPILSFDGSFESVPHLRVVKELLSFAFAPPKGHPRSKPFHDHVLAFSWSEDRIIARHYQVVPPLHDAKAESDSLVEIGPRFSLVPILILGGCFSGETLYSNDKFVSPNEARAEFKRQKAKRTMGHVAQKEKRRERIQVKGYDSLPPDELGEVFAD